MDFNDLLNNIHNGYMIYKNGDKGAVRLFDAYRNKQLDALRRQVAYKYRMQNLDSLLTNLGAPELMDKRPVRMGYNMLTNAFPGVIDDSKRVGDAIGRTAANFARHGMRRGDPNALAFGKTMANSVFDKKASWQFWRMNKRADATGEVGTGLYNLLNDAEAKDTDKRWTDYIADRKEMLSKGLGYKDFQAAIQKDMQDNAHLWDFSKMRKHLAGENESYIQNTKDWMDKNRGLFKNFKSAPLSLILGRKQLDYKALEQRVTDLYNKANSTTDPWEKAKLTSQLDVLRHMGRQEVAKGELRSNALNSNLAAQYEANHLGRWAIDSAIWAGTLGKKRGLADVVYGRDENGNTIKSDRLATDFGNNVYELTGDVNKAQNWERALRAYNWASHVPYAVGEYMLGAGALNALSKAPWLANLASAAQAAKATNTVKAEAQIAQAGIDALKSWKFWRLPLPVLQGTSDVISNGRKAEHGLGSTILTAGLDIASGIGESSPFYTFAGGTVGQALMWPFARLKAVQPAQLPANASAIAKAWNKAKIMGGTAMRAIDPKAAPAGAGIFGKTWNATKNVGRWMARDAVYTGPLSMLYEVKNAIATGQKPDFSALLGFQNNFILGGLSGLNAASNLVWDAKNIQSSAGDYNDNIQSFVESMKANPQARLHYIEQFKLPPNATDDDILEAYKTDVGATRQLSAIYNAMQAADPTVDRQAFNKELFNQYNAAAMQGGDLPADMFYDQNISPEQRATLMQHYIMAENRRTLGAVKGHVIRQKWNANTGANDDPLVQAMRNSKSARNAVIAYTSGLLGDKLSSGNTAMDTNAEKNFHTVWKELTQTERKQLLAPVQNLSAQQVVSAMQAGPMVKLEPGMKDLVTDLVFDRLRQDPAFRTDFISQFANATSTGMNLDDATKRRVMDMIQNTNPEAFFNDLDGKQFQTVSRVLMNAANGGNAFLSSLPEEEQIRIKDAFTGAAQKRMKELVMSNPIKNLPIAAALFMDRNGWSGVADVLANPIMFYGIGALLLGGGLWLGSTLFDDSDEDADNEAVLLPDSIRIQRRLRKQRELMGALTAGV